MASHHFFKPIFYRFEDLSILFHYDVELEVIRLPQFTIKKEIKTEKDLEIEMKKINDFMNELGISHIGEPFWKSKLEIAEGKEQAFFFNVEQVSKKPLSDKYIWINADEAMDNLDIAWWDRNAIVACIPSVLKN